MNPERRRHVRIPGPFHAAAHLPGGDVPVRILNLSEGGCYIEGAHLPAEGGPVELTISFPSGSSIVLSGETLLNRSDGCAVLFDDPSATVLARFGRIMNDLREKLS